MGVIVDMYRLRKECLRASDTMKGSEFDPKGEAYTAYMSVASYLDESLKRHRRYSQHAGRPQRRAK